MKYILRLFASIFICIIYYPLIILGWFICNIGAIIWHFNFDNALPPLCKKDFYILSHKNKLMFGMEPDDDFYFYRNPWDYLIMKETKIKYKEYIKM